MVAGAFLPHPHSWYTTQARLLPPRSACGRQETGGHRHLGHSTLGTSLAGHIGGDCGSSAWAGEAGEVREGFLEEVAPEFILEG